MFSNPVSSMINLVLGCSNNKNKSGYNRLETDDIDSDGEFYQKGLSIL